MIPITGKCSWPFCDKDATGHAGSNGNMCREHFHKAFISLEYDIPYCECGTELKKCTCEKPKKMKIK